MGTTISLLLPEGQSEQGLNIVRTLFAEWEQALSRFIPESELSRLNEQPGKPIPVSDLLYNVLATALTAARDTQGIYDPTMLVQLLKLGYYRTFDSLLHHTLLVGTGYRDFIRSVTRDHRLADTFSTYVHAPARTEPAMAGSGGDSLAILLPVPNLRAGIDWERETERLRDALLADLESTFGLSGLASSVRVEHRMTPSDFSRRFGAVAGNAFGVEPTVHQSAYFRAHNRGGGVQGMYHGGGGTHPGAGIPGVLLGAGGTAGLVAQDARLTATDARTRRLVSA